MPSGAFCDAIRGEVPDMTQFPNATFMKSKILDIHTHHLSSCPEQALLSCCMKDVTSAGFRSAHFLSIGIHPWFLSEEDFHFQLNWIDNVLATDCRVIALGECGLDKLCSTPYSLQTKAFLNLIKRSEDHHLPLLIHAVKYANEIMELKKKLRPHQPWIIHGFRGKKELASSYLQHGFYLSFGEKYQEEALKSIPADKLLLETDESKSDIREIYEQAADIRNVSLEELTAHIQENISRLFFNR